MAFKLIICNCGCKKHYHKSQSSPVKWKATKFYREPGLQKILEIEREDGVLFRVGDTVQRVTERGKKEGKGIIYEIQDLTSEYPSIGMRLFVYMIGSNGTAPIVNVDYENADYPNMFRFLVNITKKD